MEKYPAYPSFSSTTLFLSLGAAAFLWAGCATPGFPGGGQDQSATRTQAAREGPGKKALPRRGGAPGVQVGRSREGALEEVVVTNSIPLRKQARECGKFRVLTVAPLLAQAIQSIHMEDSVSKLFV